jgi:hypothetical protein
MDSSTFWEHVSTGTYGTKTLAFTSIIDSFGILLANDTIPLLIISSAVKIAWIVENYSLITMKHSFPLALELWSLPLTIIDYPSKDESILMIFVIFLINLNSGSHYDLFNSLSPKRCMLGSFKSTWFSSPYFATFVYLAASLSAFFASLVSFFSSTAFFSSIGRSPNSISSSENT